MVYGTYNYSIHGVYKPSNITGGPHIVPYLSIFHTTVGVGRLVSIKTRLFQGPTVYLPEGNPIYFIIPSGKLT